MKPVSKYNPVLVVVLSLAVFALAFWAAWTSGFTISF